MINISSIVHQWAETKIQIVGMQIDMGLELNIGIGIGIGIDIKLVIDRFAWLVWHNACMCVL